MDQVANDWGDQPAAGAPPPEAPASAENEWGDKPAGSVAAPVAKKLSMYDIINGPSLTAKEAPATEQKYDPNVAFGDYVLNEIKKGAMAVPGLPGTLVALARDLRGPPEKNLSSLITGKPAERSTTRNLWDLATSMNPATLAEKLIDYEQRTQKPGESPFLSGDYLAQKILGAEPEMKPPSKGAEITGEIAGFAASAPGGVVKAALTKGVVPAIKEAAKLIATSAGITAGGEIAQQSFGEGPTQKTVGQLAAIPALALPSKWASLLTKEGRAYTTQAIQEAKTASHAGLEPYIQQTITNRLAKGVQDYPQSIVNIKEAADLQARVNAAIAPTIGEVQLTPGRMTGAPGVVADEIAARKSSAEAVSKAIADDNRNAAAVLSYMNPTEKAAISRKAAIDGQIAAYNTTRDNLIAQADDITRRATRLAESATPTFTPAQRGQTLLEQRAKIKVREDAVAASLFGAAREEANRVKADFSPDTILLKSRLLSANPILAYDETNLPSVIRNIRQMLGDEQGVIGPSLAERGLGAAVADVVPVAPKRLTFDQISSLREAVNQDIASELTSSSPNKRQRLRALTEMKNTVNGAIAESDHEGVKKLFNAATDYYRDTYSPMFNKGINAKLAMKDSLGEQRVIDEKILDQYAASSTNASRFVSLFKGNPEAMAVMEDHLLDRFSSAVVKDGVVDPRRYKAWVAKNKQVLNVMDQAGVKSLGRFENIAAKTQELADRQANLVMTQKMMAKDQLRQLLGTSDHGLIVESALKDPAAMGRLTNALGQQGSKALSISVMRDLMGKLTLPPGSERIGINWSGLNQWLKDNGTTASIMFKRAYGEQEGAAHLQRLKDSARLFEIMDRVKTPMAAAANTSFGKDPLLRRVGVGFRTFFNLFRAVIAGRTSEADAAVALGGQAGSFLLNKKYNEMLQQVASDPESSKYLLTLAKTGGRPVLTKSDTAAKAKAVSGLIGKLGYYWLGGRYYGPTLRTIAPFMIQQHMEGQENAANQER